MFLAHIFLNDNKTNATVVTVFNSKLPNFLEISFSLTSIQIANKVDIIIIIWHMSFRLINTFFLQMVFIL
jgi:hypothetical protein